VIKHTIRCGPFGRTIREVKLTRSKAIRYMCLECCCWQFNEVKVCASPLCPLYPYRLGHPDPLFGTDEESDVLDEIEGVSDADDGLDVEGI